MNELEKALWGEKVERQARETAQAQAKLRYHDALSLYRLLAQHAPDALAQWKAERPRPCEYAGEGDKVYGWQLDNRRLEQMNRDLCMELEAVTAERDAAQATLQRLADATAVTWLDGYPDGLEARVLRLVEYAADTKTHSLEAFEALRAERDALKLQVQGLNTAIAELNELIGTV